MHTHACASCRLEAELEDEELPAATIAARVQELRSQLLLELERADSGSLGAAGSSKDKEKDKDK